MTARTKPKALHLAAILSALALTGGVLAACGSSEPAPTPTPTAVFASEDEAFAAAEKVYLAYNDAGNARRDGAETPDPQDFLIGLALEADITAANALRARGLRGSGQASVASFTPASTTIEGADVTVVAMVCLDVSDVRLLDSTGIDVTPTSRPDVVAQSVTFRSVEERLRISNEQSADESSC